MGQLACIPRHFTSYRKYDSGHFYWMSGQKFVCGEIKDYYKILHLWSEISTRKNNCAATRSCLNNQNIFIHITTD